MHAVVVDVTINDPQAAERALHEQLVPRVSQLPGFVTGYWTLKDNSGLTMILVEQNLDFIAALSQRILIIQKGTITREVKPGDLGDPSLVGEFIGITT